MEQTHLIDQIILIASLIVAAISLFFSGIVFLKGKESVVNRSFLGVGISISCWIFAVLIESWTMDERVTLLGARIELAAAALFLFFIYKFSYHFGEPFRKFKEHGTFAAAFAVAVATIGLATPFVLEGARRTTHGLMHAYGPLWFIIVAYVLVFVLANVYIIGSKLIRASKEGRSETRWIFIGMLLSGSIVLATNFFLPFFYHMDTMRFGPLGIIFLTSFSSYAILRHGIFNVRVVAAELLALALLLFITVNVPFANSETELFIDLSLLVVMSVASFFTVRSAIEDVRQREELELTASALEEANGELVRLDVVRKGFLSFVSHQLRQPLVVMKGYASLIHEGEFGEASPELKHASKKIYDATEQMNLLISNFLDIRAIEEGKIVYSFKDVDVAKLVRDITDDYKVVAEEKGLAFTYVADPPVVEAIVDPLKFRQVIQNLIDNAVKYTGHGSIDVSVKASAADVHITIKDSGMGIPEELQGRLFEEFARGKAVTERGIRGTGLGLYFVKRMIEAHHGSVTASSEGEGKGTTFSITIPREQ